MLNFDHILLDRSLSRQKFKTKDGNIIDIIDIKCGHPYKGWSNPTTCKLKKLRFSNPKPSHYEM